MKSRVKNNVPTFALPTQRLVVRTIFSPGISNFWHPWRIDFPILCLRICRHLNSFTVSTGPAPCFTPWWPWPYLCPHHSLIIIYSLQNHHKYNNIIYLSIMRQWNIIKKSKPNSLPGGSHSGWKSFYLSEQKIRPCLLVGDCFYLAALKICTDIYLQ